MLVYKLDEAKFCRKKSQILFRDHVEISRYESKCVKPTTSVI